MISADYLRELFAFHARANQRILTTAAGMTPAELDAAPIPAHPSFRETLVHAISAEWIWRSRIGGTSPSAMLSPGDFPSLEVIGARWADETQALRDLIAGLGAGDIARPIAYTRQGRSYTTPLWQILVHVANHGTQHRSELAAMLTAVGRSPGDLDLIRYFRDEL